MVTSQWLCFENIDAFHYKKKKKYINKYNAPLIFFVILSYITIFKEHFVIEGLLLHAMVLDL